jgi:hypothetical protein
MILDPEAEFRRLVAVARVLPTRFESEIARDDVDVAIERYDFPAYTALARAHWATAQYEPAVSVLGDGRTAHGCMLLLRGLLELWAEFLYLTAKPDPSERRIRAVQIEIETARHMVNSLKTADIAEPLDVDRSMAAVAERLACLEEIKRSEGWTVTGRKYGEVTDWLDKTGLGWPTPMYRGFSDAAHHRVPEWASETFGSPTWYLKAVRLKQCVMIYSNIVCLALLLVRPDGDGSFEKAARGLLADDVLRLALDGQLD